MLPWVIFLHHIFEDRVYGSLQCYSPNIPGSSPRWMGEFPSPLVAGGWRPHDWFQPTTSKQKWWLALPVDYLITWVRPLRGSFVLCLWPAVFQRVTFLLAWMQEWECCWCGAELPADPPWTYSTLENSLCYFKTLGFGHCYYRSTFWPIPTNKKSLCVITFVSPVLQMTWHLISTAK